MYAGAVHAELLLFYRVRTCGWSALCVHAPHSYLSRCFLGLLALCSCWQAQTAFALAGHAAAAVLLPAA
jgi:hypothetical protein